jgi:hypothetical protein
MKQKTRYNIRLAIKKGVIVQPSADVNLFFQLIQATGERDRFGVHSLAYYQRTFDLFHNRGECELLLAELAGIVAAMFSPLCIYGALGEHSQAMPTICCNGRRALRAGRAEGMIRGFWML